MHINSPLFIVDNDGHLSLQLGQGASGSAATLPFTGMVPPCPLEQLGDSTFCRDHGLRYPSVGGSMAKGISSVAMARALGQTGLLGMFGAAGLPYPEVV
ncbi:MAG: 2-nitropropane dioxygenase, partial [Desulfuromonadaceae bacterium]